MKLALEADRWGFLYAIELAHATMAMEQPAAGVSRRSVRAVDIDKRKKDVTEPAQVRGIGNTAQLLALIDHVEPLLRKGNLRHLN